MTQTNQMTTPFAKSDKTEDAALQKAKEFAQHGDAHSERSAYIVLLLVATAEVLSAIGAATLGVLLHVALVVWLLRVTMNDLDIGSKRLYLTLLLLPLLRIVSFGLPLTEWPQISWYLAASLPVFVGMYVVTTETDWTRQQLGLKLGNVPRQLAVGASGLIFGWLAYLILRPVGLVERLSLDALWLPVLILLLCTGLFEELVYRGMLQHAAVEIVGEQKGVLLSATLYAAMHIGHGSMAYVILIFVVGLMFSYVLLRSKSILGVTLAHGLANIILFLILPNLLVG